MKLKKYLIIILLIFLLSLTCVNAEDNQNIDNDEKNIYVDSSIGNDNNNGNSWQTPIQTIQKAIELTPNNQTTNIYLNNATFSGKNNTKIIIENKNTVNIIGSTTTIIDGENQNHIFTITNNTKITLQNIQFINAYVNDTQSKSSVLNIENNTQIEIKNCQFTNNTLITQVKNNENLQITGGAINAKNNNKITIINSIFNKNTGINGGAINIQNTTELNILNNTFTNNKANINNLIKNTTIKKEKEEITHGVYQEISYIDYSNAYLEENYGGAIYLENNNNSLINNNKLSNNTANNGGSITLKNNKNTQINNITFTDNKLIFFRTTGSSYTSHYDLKTSNYGNSIYINNTTTTINNITLNNNNGGLGSIKIDNSNVTITNSTLTNNIATRGGAIYNTGNLNINNTQFINNDGNLFIGTVQEVFIKDYIDGIGSDIYNKGQATITNTIFTNTQNSTLRFNTIGGAIYNKGTMTLNNTEISNKKTEEYSFGSAIANIGNLTINNSIIKDNIISLTSSSVAPTFTGAIHNEGLLTATNTIFKNNMATGLKVDPWTGTLTKGSGNIYNTGNGILNITNSIFINKEQYLKESYISNNRNHSLATRVMQDIYIARGSVISLENNYWNGEDPTTNEHTNYNNIKNYYILDYPEYNMADINESINITLTFKLNNNQKSNINPPFDRLNLTINTTINKENKVFNQTIKNNTAVFTFNWTQEKGLYPVNIKFLTKTPKISYTRWGTYNYYKTPVDKTYELLIDVGKEYADIKVNMNNTITKGENLTFNINVTGNYTHTPTGNITVYLTDINTYISSLSGNKVKVNTIKQEDQTYTLTLINGTAHFNKKIVDGAGYANIKITYEGDEDYFKAFYYDNITIKKLNPELKIEVPEVYVGDEIQINVSKLPGSDRSTGYIYIDNARWSNVIFNTDNITLSYKRTFWLNNYGNYTIKISYDKTANYEASTATATLIVKRYETDLTLNASDIMVGQNLTINATLTPDTVPGGNANITINNKTDVLFLNKGTTQINITNLKAGTYNITIQYLGTNKYTPSTANTTIIVHKYLSNLTVERTTYDNLTGTITINALGTGNVTLWINNKNYTQQIIDNTTTFHITYNNGTNYIFIFYTGDEYYEYATWNTTENITYKYFLKAENMTYYQNEEFNYTITLLDGSLKPLQDYINITFNNTQHTIKTNMNGTIQFPLKLKKGTYNITIQYNQSTLKNTINITTAYIYPEMNITANNITYGEELSIKINITKDATGTITINIDNQKQTQNITKGEVNAKFHNITGGIHEITATYNGNNKYRIITQKTNITVEKQNTTLQISTGNITLGENLYIYATTNRNDATGNITFYIENLYNPRNRTLENNTATWYISPLNRGQYTITATYNGDNNYNPSNTTYTLTINPQINLTINAQDTEYAEEIIIEAHTIKGLNGYINFQITDINENITLENGKATLKINTPLKTGTYTIKATYITTNFQSQTINKTINITPANPIENIYIKDILAGETEIINITLKNQSLKYTITIDNKKYTTPNITIPELSKGPHILQIQVVGNENYQTINQTIIFDAKTQTTTINITTTNITYGEDLHVKAILLSNATGNITYKIADKTITTTQKEIDISNLNGGTYTLTVTYNGNSYYQSSTTQTTVVVKKANSAITINTSEIILGENLFIYASTNRSDATGNITFRIIGQYSPRNRTLENNTATWYISPPNRGQYTITATYYGDNNYKPSNTTYTLTVDPEINLTINTQDTEYAEEIIIEAHTIKELIGYINFQIADINENITLENGKATLKINTPLKTGTYTVNATFMTTNFQSESVNTTINIIPANPIENIYIKDILAGETEIINITLKNQTLKYLITIDDKKYDTLNIAIPNLTKDTHILHIQVIGNENYQTINKTITFNGKTQTTTINITTTNITYGESLHVKTILTENATGNITYKIADKTITTTEKEINISDLDAGTYTLTVTYNGNSYYQSSTTQTTVIVDKLTPEISINIDAKTTNDPVNITVHLSHNITGEITYRIYGLYSPRNKTLTNGISNWLIEALNKGEYELIAIYSGNNNFNPVNITETISINQAKTYLNSKFEVNPDDTVTITATLTSSDDDIINADITLTIANKFYRMKIVNNTGLFTTMKLEPGNYRYTLAYAGNTNLSSSNTHETFKIKETPELTANITINDDNTATFKINTSKTENITITIQNTTYPIKIENNTGTFTTDKLNPGEYKYEIEYPGDENTKSIIIKDTFTIKQNPEINYNYEINPDNSITLKIKTNMNKANITLQINNKNYLVKIKNGTGLYTTPILETGNYTYSLIYDGNQTMKNNTQSGKFIIKNNVELTVNNLIKYYSASERLNIKLTCNNQSLTNQSIYITINGITYKRTTDSNGETSIAINLNSGKYTATITFNNTEYNTKSKNINITIKNTVYGDNIIKIIRNDTQYYAIFTDNQGNPLTNTNVSFNINGVFYTRTTNENGIAKLNLNLDQGKYILTAINPQTGEKYANNITVIPSIIENNDLTKYHRNDSHYIVKILNKDGTVAGAGEKVTFNINGVFYERTTNKTGHAQLNINLQPGDYIITVEHDGCYVSNNIKVLPALKAYNLVKKYGNSRPFSATLVDGMGSPLAGKSITFNINGVFYTRTTNENGIANLNINLQAGKYIITTTYNEAIISNVVTII